MSVARVVLDAILLPVRLLRALLSYLDIFSIRYSGKPLVSPGGSRQNRADVRKRIVAGNVMNAAARAEGHVARVRRLCRRGLCAGPGVIHARTLSRSEAQNFPDVERNVILSFVSRRRAERIFTKFQRIS